MNGARAQSMAGAQLASVSDATSGFWNPAGLVGVDTDLQLAAMHNEWFASIGRYDYIGLAAPIANKSRYLGFTFIRFGVDNIPNTLSLYEKDGTVNYNNITTFNAADYAFMLHYCAAVFECMRIAEDVATIQQSWSFVAEFGLSSFDTRLVSTSS